MITRRKLTTLDKLKVLVVQARCPDCGERLGALEDTQFDHVQALALGGADAVENLVGRHRVCHERKTNGPGGEKRITTAGSDTGKMKKVRALTRQQEEMRARMLAKAEGVEPPRGGRRKRAWPKRSFAGGQERRR